MTLISGSEDKTARLWSIVRGTSVLLGTYYDYVSAVTIN